MTRPTPQQQPPVTEAQPPPPITEPLTQAVVAADLANALAPVDLPVLNAVEAANVISLVQTQDLAQELATQAAERASVKLIEGFAEWYQFAKVFELAKALSELVDGFKHSVARLADGYMGEVLSHMTGTRIKPTGIRKTDIDRFGVDPIDVYKRVADTARYQQSKIDQAMMDVVAGADPETLTRLVSPNAAALHRAHQLIRSDLAHARRAQLHHSMINAAERGLTSDNYRRVIHPELSQDGEGTCGLCIAASTRIYHVKDLMPIHPGCHCGEVPIGKDGYDPGGAINDSDFGRLYADAGGSTAAEDLRKTRYKVDEHGELGPVLRPADEPTRQPVGGKFGKPDPNTERKVRQHKELARRNALRQKRDALQRSHDDIVQKMDADPENWPPEKWRPLADDIQQRADELTNDIGDRDVLDAQAANKRIQAEAVVRNSAHQRELDAAEKEYQRRIAAGDPLADLPMDDGPHTLEDDVLLTNPRFAEGGAYAMNCVHVVQAEELRRRGFDVVATPLPQEFWSQQGRSLDEALGNWIGDPDRYLVRGSAVGIKNIAQGWPDGARGWVNVNWKRGGSHVFNVEKVGDRTVWSDAQKGVYDFNPDTYFNRAQPVVRIVRIDDLNPTRDVEQFVTPSDHAKFVTTGHSGVIPAAAPSQRARDIATSKSIFGLTPVGRASPEPLAMRGYDDLPAALQRKIMAKLEHDTNLPEIELERRAQDNLDRLYHAGNKADANWYREQGAELTKRADAINSEFGTHLTPEQLAGMVSVTSTKKRWVENKAFAEGIARKLAADEPFDVTNMMITDYNTWAGKRRGNLAVPHPDLKPGRYKPSELPTDFVASKTPGIPKAMNTDIGIRAVTIFRGERSVDDIVNGPKQRNFINNLLEPEDTRFITVDTWHYRAIMEGVPLTREIGPKGNRHTYTYTLEEWADRDLSVQDGRALLFGYDPTKDRYDDANIDATVKAADQFAPQLFFQSGPASKADGWESDYGTYPWFVKQTQIAAERLGVSPIDLQAVVWVAMGGGV
jgi:hypothetical protein